MTDNENPSPKKTSLVRRALWITGASLLGLFLLALLGMFILWKTIFGGNAPLEGGRALNDHAWVVKDGFVSMTLLKGPSGFVLVDGGASGKTDELVDVLRQHGGTLADVRAVLITHAHGDHLAVLRHLPGAALLCMEREVPLVEGREGLPGPFGRVMTNHLGLHIARGLADGEVSEWAGLKIKSYLVPGHTPGHGVYLVDGLLFLGDTVNADKEGHVKSSFRGFSADPQQNNESVKSLVRRLVAEKTPVDRMVFSHSAALKGLAPLQTWAESATP